MVHPTAIKAVSATSMREGMVLYDERGRELWACPNVDSRAGAEAAELVRSGAAREIYDHAGDWVSITAPARFLWLARHEPDVSAAPRIWECWGTGYSPSCAASLSPTHRSVRAPECSSSPTAPGQIECSRSAASIDRFPAGGRLRHRDRRSLGQRRRADRASRGDARGRRWRRHAARAARHRGCAARIVHDRRRLLLAAHGRHRRTFDRPRGAPADALPHRP